jgi:hypothetical protein
MSTPTLTLTRTNETCRSKDKSGNIVVGRRGKLTVSGSSRTFHTIERGGGYVYLRPGTYQCYTGSRASNGKPCIQIVHSQKNSRGEIAGIVMHTANYPHQVLGCIAPGLSVITQGVSGSGRALKAIFEAVGATHKLLGHKTTTLVKCTLIISGHV